MTKTLVPIPFRLAGNHLLRSLPLLFILISGILSGQSLQVTVSKNNVSCFGGNNGTAMASPAGGVQPYTYHWNNNASTATITGLTAGTYSVTVTDANQATAVGSVTVGQPNPLGVQTYVQSQICGIVPDGKATAVPFGGTPPYTYLWNNNGTTAQIIGLTAGTYTVTVTDSKGCTTSGSATVYFWNEGIWLMDTAANVSCFGQGDGFAHVSAMSGTPPYTYLWSTGDTTPDAFNLAPGIYEVTVTDANGCSNFTSDTITEPAALTCQTSTVPGACGLSGSATVNPAGGTAPYTVLWSTNSTSLSITAPPGMYSVTVTDANDCTCSSDVTIGSTSGSLSANITVNAGAGCTIGGDATATASGGTGNYSYLWDNGQTTAAANNLTVGNHVVTITDNTTGCTGTATANIPAAPQLVGSAALVSNATCLLGGSATASATGGTTPYTFHWDNGQTTATATNLSAGPHSATITDAKGCIATATVMIGQNQGPTVTAAVVSNATCTTGGSATANATGGAGSYVYLWDNMQTTSTATNLSVGAHSVTVTDGAGCSATASVTITQTGAPTITVTNSSNAGCNGAGGSATVNASGGTPPYTYLWSNMGVGPTINNLLPGTYTATATDAAGCTASASVTITAVIPPTVVITASSNQTCAHPGSATASATGGGGSFTYLWDNNETTATATNLVAGVHSVTVTDAAGCTATASVTIGYTDDGVKIGDFVWYDDDQNGAQHALEPGVPGFSVALIKAGPDGLFGTSDDETVQSTTTNASGLYQFACVTPGTYILKFSGLPAGYEFSDKDKVNDDCADSDVNSNGKTNPFTITAGQADDLCFDAGIHIFCDNVLNAGVICCDQTICEGQTPALIYNALPPTGGTGNILYQWMQLVQMGPAMPTWMAIPGATGIDYQPGPLTQTSYFMRCAKRQGCNFFLESNIVTITVNEAGTPGCDNFTMNITAKVAGKTNVILEWTTLMPETDQFMYIVEHSPNQQDWTDISTVLGLHDATKPNHYSVLHQTPVGGENHYRVKRLNAAGMTSYSPVRSITLDIALESSVDVYPNPAFKFLVIKNVKEFGSDVNVQIINTGGDILHTVTIPQGTLYYEELPVEGLPSGIYMVRVLSGDGNVKTYKITKI